MALNPLNTPSVTHRSVFVPPPHLEVFFFVWPRLQHYCIYNFNCLQFGCVVNLSLQSHGCYEKEVTT